MNMVAEGRRRMAVERGVGGRRGRMAFFREFFKAPVQLGTCFTSSRALSRAMVQGIGIENARAVVEFGPGPGPLTAEILKRIPAGCRFFTVERNAGMARAFRERFPNVSIHEDDAGNVRRLCEREGIAPGEVDCIVSSIPFLLFPEGLQRHILHEAAGVMRRGGRFATLTYRTEGLMPGVKKFRRLMEAEFSEVRLAKVVLANVPPTYIYRCTK